MATKLGKKTVQNVRNWIKKLRSGKYEQGAGSLCNNDTYCCLGVACDMMGVKYYTVDQVKYYNFPSQPADNSIFPSKRFMKRNFGMDMDMADTLAQMNDSGDTFNEIADFIENWLKERS